MTLQLRLLCAAALCLLLPGCRLEQESLPTKAEPPASKAIEAAKGEPGAVKGSRSRRGTPHRAKNE